MSDITDVPKKIRIHKVVGGTGQDQDELKNCYFVQLGTDNVYQFYTPNNSPIATVPPFVSSGGFEFIRSGKNWHVSQFVIDPDHAHGQWSIPGQMDDADDGSFQAQAGPGVDQETAASAYAG
jgi:hypothetical protein